MTMPSRLYKYQPVSLEALRNVQRCEIWFSRPERFNDPFDCACRLDRAPTSEDEYQQLFERQLAKLRPADRENYKKHYLEAEKNPEAAKAKRRFRDFVDSVSTSSLEAWRREARGVACFSELKDNPLMWAHYADRHTGFCLEFDTSLDPFECAARVEYRSEVPSFSAPSVAQSPDLLVLMLTVKAACWSYEREWRIFNHWADSPHVIAPACLTAIYFGVATDPGDKGLLANILRGRPTQLFEFRLAVGSFDLECHPYTT